MSGVFYRVRSLALVVLVAVAASTSGAVPAKGQKIMVAGPSPYAVDIAREIHLKGGNAVDVTVACLLSMAVTHPYYASLGGGGFALVKMGSETKALDFRERAPAAAGPDLYKDKPENAPRDGGLAVGVPGISAGLWDLHKKYGKLKWKELFPPAIALAEKGFRVSGEWAALTARNAERFNDAGLKLFFHKDKVPLKPGDLLKQPGLAALLKDLSVSGPKAFYEGKHAQDLVQTVKATGGIVTAEDLKSYKTRWLEPITADFAGYKIHLMPPPSSGGVVIKQALRLMELTKLGEKAPLSTDEFHYLTEIMKLSYRGRSLLGDPDFAKNPIAELTDEKYLAKLAAMIAPNKSIDVEPLKEVKFEPPSTTHISVMDGNGDAVAMTVTINGDWGSGVVTQKTGVALNNEMDDFTTIPGKPNMFGLIQGEANQVRAGARPLSSMSPTIAVKDGKAVLAVGAPGGPRIISSVLQVTYRALTQKIDVEQAVQAPRVHHQFLPNVVKYDDFRFSPETVEALKARGHKLETGSTGKVYAIRREPDGILTGSADMRGEGAAGGL